MLKREPTQICHLALKNYKKGSYISILCNCLCFDCYLREFFFLLLKDLNFKVLLFVLTQL